MRLPYVRKNSVKQNIWLTLVIPHSHAQEYRAPKHSVLACSCVHACHWSMMHVRGGIHQRLAASEPPSQDHGSSLAAYLLQVQAISSCAMTDVELAAQGKKLPDLDFLSRLGSEGRFPNNMYRDVMRRLNATPGLPPCTQCEIPSLTGATTASLCLPHETFAHLYHQRPKQFFKQFLPHGHESMISFWGSCRGGASLKDEPMMANLKPDRAIPIATHGDEVPVAGRGKCWCKQAVVFSWFSMLTPMLPTKESLMLIWSCNPAQFVGGVGGTLDCFWRILAWSFTILATGRWPRADWRGIHYAKGTQEHSKAGEPIAGGYHCILFSITGDLDYCNKFLGMQHWGSATRPCSLCRCTKHGEKSYRDFRSIAGWRTSLLTTTQWRAAEDKSTCALFDVPNVSGLSVQPDLMHVKYLGYMQYFLGSVLFLLTHSVMAASPKENCKTIGLMIARYQRRRDTSAKFPSAAYGRLTIFLRKQGYPKLRGKAAHIKHVVPALESIWKKFTSPENVNHRRIALIFKLDREIEKLLGDYDPVAGFAAVPADVLATLQEKQIQKSQLMVMLEEIYASEPKPLFNIVSKLHYAMHIIDNSATVHPHLNWCWKGEDFMNTTSVLVGLCLRGRSDVSATIKAMDKYRYAMHLQWKSD